MTDRPAIKPLVPTERLDQLIGSGDPTSAETHDMAVELILWRQSKAADEIERLWKENASLKAGIKRLSDEEELVSETTPDEVVSMVSLSAKLATAEADIERLTRERSEAWKALEQFAKIGELLSDENALEDAAKAAFTKAQSVYRADHDHFPLKHTWETTFESVREGWRAIAYAAVEAAVMPPLGTQPEPRRIRSCLLDKPEAVEGEAVPEGWQLVPKKMNADMINAWSGGLTVTSDEVAYRTTFQDAWKRVLDVAPRAKAGVALSALVRRLRSLVSYPVSTEIDPKGWSWYVAPDAPEVIMETIDSLSAALATPADTDAAQSELDRLRRELEEARRALEPFATAVEKADASAAAMGFSPSFDAYAPEWSFTFGQLRAARAALRAGEEGL